MQIIRAKAIDPMDSGVIVKLSNLEALFLRNMCANISVLAGPDLLINAAQEMRSKFFSVYASVNPPLCAANYKLMAIAGDNMNKALNNLGDF